MKLKQLHISKDDYIINMENFIELILSPRYFPVYYKNKDVWIEDILETIIYLIR